MTPLAENALLVIVSVSVAGPAWEYVTVMVQLPPGAMDPEQVLVWEKALLDPLANVSDGDGQIQVARVGERGGG